MKILQLHRSEPVYELTVKNQKQSPPSFCPPYPLGWAGGHHSNGSNALSCWEDGSGEEALFHWHCRKAPLQICPPYPLWGGQGGITVTAPIEFLAGGWSR